MQVNGEMMVATRSQEYTEQQHVTTDDKHAWMHRILNEMLKYATDVKKKP